MYRKAGANHAGRDGHEEERRQQQRHVNTRHRCESRNDHGPRRSADAPAEVERAERRCRALGRQPRHEHVGRRYHAAESNAGDGNGDGADGAIAECQAGKSSGHQHVAGAERARATDAANDQSRQRTNNDAAGKLNGEQCAGGGVAEVPPCAQPRQHRSEDRRNETGDDEAGKEERAAAHMRVARLTHLGRGTRTRQAGPKATMGTSRWPVSGCR